MFRPEACKFALEHLPALAPVLSHVLPLEPARTLARLRGEARNPSRSMSQSRLGWDFLPPMISTTSPFAR
jgi:hypothetical protein